MGVVLATGFDRYSTLLVIADVRGAGVGIGTEVPQADERLGAGVLDDHAAFAPPWR